MIRRLALVALLLCGRAAAAQNAPTAPSIRIDDAGSGAGPEILARALARPHDVVPPASDRWVVKRGTDNRRTLIVLGRDVVIEGKVQGDVIVVAGDLYMHPGGAITGRAISIGGGVYESMLATIEGGVTAFRDFTYDIAPIPGGYSLRYRSLEPAGPTGLTWPGLLGFSMPTYDRTNGLSLGIGPNFTTAGEKLVVSPRVTYRSQLGQFDPSGSVDAVVAKGTTVRLRAGRFTASNDRWIRADLVNSAIFLFNGDDTRNYYRTTGGDLAVDHIWESANGDVTPYVGARYERASSVRPGTNATSAPWTFLARGDDERDDRFRLNPTIDDGAITSGIAGLIWRWNKDGVIVSLRADGEASSDFAQLTVDGRATFPTFKTQILKVEGHVVTTGGGAVPRQRFVYIGGPGTIPTIDLLSESGDQLVYVDVRYAIPIDGVRLPLVGSPVVTLREALGGAKLGGFPTLEQATGVRVNVSGLYAEWSFDPAHRTSQVTVGLSFPH